MSVYIVPPAIQPEPVLSASAGAADKNRVSSTSPTRHSPLTGKQEGEQGVREGRADEKGGYSAYGKGQWSKFTRVHLTSDGRQGGEGKLFPVVQG